MCLDYYTIYTDCAEKIMINNKYNTWVIIKLLILTQIMNKYSSLCNKIYVSFIFSKPMQTPSPSN